MHASLLLLLCSKPTDFADQRKIIMLTTLSSSDRNRDNEPPNMEEKIFPSTLNVTQFQLEMTQLIGAIPEMRPFGVEWLEIQTSHDRVDELSKRVSSLCHLRS
jgi:hypothetical protein